MLKCPGAFGLPQGTVDERAAGLHRLQKGQFLEEIV